MPMSTTLHILANYQNLFGWRIVLNCMRTHPTLYYVESSVRVAYMETHPYNAWHDPLSNTTCDVYQACVSYEPAFIIVQVCSY